MKIIEEKIFFSDETQIFVSNENRLYVWRTQDEAYRPECVGHHRRNVRISAMFWGCVTYSGAETLVQVSGNMNSDKYIDTRSKCMAIHCKTFWKISIYIPG